MIGICVLLSVAGIFLSVAAFYAGKKTASNTRAEPQPIEPDLLQKAVSSNIEIIETQNAVISNMAQINAELHMRLSQFEAVAYNEKTEMLEAQTEDMLSDLRAAGILEEGGNP